MLDKSLFIFYDIYMAQKPIETPQATGMAYKRSFFDFVKIGIYVIFSITAVALIFLFILNYFNIVSLSETYSKQLGWLPHENESKNSSININQKPDMGFDTSRNFWTITGTVSDVSGDDISITSGNVTLKFQKDDTTSCIRTINSFPDLNNLQNPNTVIAFCSDVVTGKKVTADYNTENGVNKLIEITLN